MCVVLDRVSSLLACGGKGYLLAEKFAKPVGLFHAASFKFQLRI
jgi:hypothetical protein